MTPFIYLAAAPKAPARVRTLTRQEGVRQLLQQPPYTRHAGWNLVTLDRARIVDGRRLSLANGRRKHIALHEDGTFLAVGTCRTSWPGTAATCPTRSTSCSSASTTGSNFPDEALPYTNEERTTIEIGQIIAP